MANGTTTPSTTGTTPSAGGLNYDDYWKKVQQAAATTRDVQPVDISGAKSTVDKMLSDDRPGLQKAGSLGETLISQFETEQEQQKGRAEKAASALETVGTSTLAGMRRLDAIEARIGEQVSNASEAWGAAAEKADEYVKAARGRVGEVLDKLDTIHRQISDDLDFAKAHDMQATVQAVMGSMKNEERNIVENYGVESKEYQQFKASKQTALTTIQSNIHANYAKLRDQRGQTYLNAVNDAYTKSNMYLGFQEQQHVEMLKFRDQQRNAFALQAAELEVGIENMKMAGMENLANWIIETPTFTMDAAPLISAINSLNETATNQWLAWKIGHKTGGESGFDWGSLASAGLGAVTGGVGGALGGALGSKFFGKGSGEKGGGK